MIGVGLIGYGYWGPNMARNVQDNSDVHLSAICDIDANALARAETRYPFVKCTSDPDDLFANDEIQAVIIATPVSTHYHLASQALLAGKHVLVEKPIADSAAAATELVQLANKFDRVLMVDHTYVYSPAVQKLKRIVSSGELGDILYFDSIRINLGIFQHDINVIWDLAPHDLSIMYYLIEKVPRFVSAHGANLISNHLESMAYVNLRFDDGLIAHFHVNWFAPVKIRQTLIGGNKKMVVYNDLDPTEKVKVYDRGVEVNTREGIYKTLVQYRTGDIEIPHLENREPLQIEIECFVESIATGHRPPTAGEDSLQIVRVLEATEESIKLNGVPVPLT